MQCFDRTSAGFKTPRIKPSFADDHAFDASRRDYEKAKKKHDNKLESYMKKSKIPLIKYRFDSPNQFSLCDKQFVSNLQYYVGDGSQVYNGRGIHAFDLPNVKKEMMPNKDCEADDKILRSIPTVSTSVTRRFLCEASNAAKEPASHRRRSFSACPIRRIANFKPPVVRDLSLRAPPTRVQILWAVDWLWGLTSAVGPKSIVDGFDGGVKWFNAPAPEVLRVGWLELNRILFMLSDGTFYAAYKTREKIDATVAGFSANFKPWVMRNQGWFNKNRRNWQNKAVVLYRAEMEGSHTEYRRARHFNNPSTTATSDYFVEVDSGQVLPIARSEQNQKVGRMPLHCSMESISYFRFRFNEKLTEGELLEYVHEVNTSKRVYVVGFDLMPAEVRGVDYDDKSKLRDRTSTIVVARPKKYYVPGLDQLFCGDAACFGMCCLPHPTKPPRTFENPQKPKHWPSCL